MEQAKYCIHPALSFYIRWFYIQIFVTEDNSATDNIVVECVNGCLFFTIIIIPSFYKP